MAYVIKNNSCRFMLVVAAFLFSSSVATTDLVATAQGSLLWHQPPDSDYCAVIDQEIPDYNIFSTYLVSDVSFNVEVTIDSVTVYFTDRGQGTWLDVTQGVLNIFDGDALTSEDDPASGGDHGLAVTNVTVTDLNDVLAVTADLDPYINLGPGNYWVGLTPIAEFEMFGEEFHLHSSEFVGGPTMYRNPGGGFGLGKNWGSADQLCPDYGDAAMTITGVTCCLPVVIPADGLVLFRGILIEGDLPDTFASDDARMRFNPGFTLNSTEAPVWLIFDGTLPSDNPASLEIVMESQAGTPGLTGTFEAWNWTSMAYDVVDISPASFNDDVVVTASLSDGISDYAQAGTGAVRTRVGWRKTGFTINYPWEVRLDQMVWIVQ